MEKVKITLRRSIIGQKPSVRKTVKALKLGKINSSSEFQLTPELVGMIRVVQHIIRVEKL